MTRPPTTSELREAIANIYAHKDQSLRLRRTGRFGVRYSAFAGPLQVTHNISVCVFQDGKAQLAAGDRHVAGPGSWRVWKFDRTPTQEEAFATFAEYFAEIATEFAKQEAERKAELAEFYARHGQHALILEYCV